MFHIALTDHLEGPLDQPSTQIYNEVADLILLADHLAVRYAFFTEHHAHTHQGHLPTPLLFALHLANQTKQIHLGTAVICANLHHPLDIAEQVAVADLPPPHKHPQHTNKRPPPHPTPGRPPKPPPHPPPQGGQK